MLAFEKCSFFFLKGLGWLTLALLINQKYFGGNYSSITILVFFVKKKVIRKLSNNYKKKSPKKGKQTTYTKPVINEIACRTHTFAFAKKEPRKNVIKIFFSSPRPLVFFSYISRQGKFAIVYISYFKVHLKSVCQLIYAICSALLMYHIPILGKYNQ